MARHVAMLATVLAATNTPLPVSVGVFGAWGSGKTTFMQLLSKQLTDLAASERDRRAAEPESPPVYVAEIRRIVFNAWHYADANLWASLAAHIFEELANPRSPVDAVAIRREDVLSHLTSLREERVRLQAEKQAADARRAELEARLQTAADGVETASDTLRTLAGAVAAEVTASDEWASARRELTESAVQAGLPEAATSEPQRLAGELQGAQADLRRIWCYWTASGARRRLGIGAVAAGLALGAGLATTQRYLPALLTFATPIAGLLIMARRGVAIVRRKAVVAAAALARVEADAARRADAARAKVESELEQAAAEAAALSAAVAKATLAAEEAAEELDALGVARRWETFVSGRNQSADYRGQLGLVSGVRRDFEDLVALLGERLAPELVAAGGGGTRAPERIVLFIDDLDRCEPDRVVEVLDAVHLLLAIDLFVVVVGVDPLWLVQSLGSERGAFTSDRSDAAEVLRR